MEETNRVKCVAQHRDGENIMADDLGGIKSFLKEDVENSFLSNWIDCYGARKVENVTMCG